VKPKLKFSRTAAAAGGIAALMIVPTLVGSADAATVVGTSACAKTYPVGYWWTYPTTNINLRTGPGTSYTSLGILIEGTGVEVRCKAKTAGWMRVKVLNGPNNGRTGWVASKYLA
jgi:uncharacterized protein YraI